GRPLPLGNVWDGSMPIAWYMVLRSWDAVTGCSFGYSPRALELPTIWPILSPPPETMADMTGDQWSRPPSFMLTFGVRPNSPHMPVPTALPMPRSHRSWTRLATPRSTCGSCCFRVLKLLLWVSQPPIERVTQPTPASMSRRAVRNCSTPLYRSRERG